VHHARVLRLCRRDRFKDGPGCTLMSRLGVPEDIAELAIGHVRADLIARYNKDEAWAGRSDAFERVSDHIAAAIGGAAQFC